MHEMGSLSLVSLSVNWSVSADGGTVRLSHLALSGVALVQPGGVMVLDDEHASAHSGHAVGQRNGDCCEVLEGMMQTSRSDLTQPSSANT